MKKSQILVKKESSHIGGVTTRSGTSKLMKSMKTEEISDANNSEDEVTGYICNLCDETFKNHSQYKTHKINCTKIPKKYVCPKCSKGFTAKCYLTQHYDFKHTNKPKKYYCKPCNKYFQLEKTMKEHNRRLHNEGDYKYMCNFCSRGFWHLQEFKLHHTGHTGVKPYKCSQCEVASFVDVHRLNNHLKACGKMNSFECNQCGKMYSDQKSLSTHVSDTHNKTERKCPICPNAVYTSEGGYYTHMRNKHKIRNGRKLKEVLKEQTRKEAEESDNKITDNGEEDESDKKKKKRNDDKKSTPKQKRTDSSDEENTPQNKKKKTDSENKTIKSCESDNIKKSKSTISDNKSSLKGTPAKKTTKTDEKKVNKMVYHCPILKCNGLEFDDEQLYFKHLFKQHKIK